MAVVFVIAVFVLLIAAASRTTTSYEESASSPPPSTQNAIESWEKDHFIQKYLHRNDRKHDRHKRNQTPW